MAQTRQKRAAAKREPAGFTLVFDIERETKNTFRYQERNDDDNPVIGYLYMAKDHLEEIKTPDVVTVTIVPGE